uniref:Uncharacterized protein n=1 Tax=Ananas comosus var. bracteatus TaxID=296719 RepID=A0A6V7P9W5_ANACO|nr:unnamed protein product [Ananas comosus var. bracteatus]
MHASSAASSATAVVVAVGGAAEEEAAKFVGGGGGWSGATRSGALPTPSTRPASACCTRPSRRPDLVQLLLEFGADVEPPGLGPTTPLEASAPAGEALIAELLLARGAQQRRGAGSAAGPVHAAAAGGHASALRLLLLLLHGVMVHHYTINGAPLHHEITPLMV